MIYTIREMMSFGYSVSTLDILSVIAILFSISVIISKNPILSVLFLIGLFLSISCYLILSGLNFIGLSYLLVYLYNIEDVTTGWKQSVVFFTHYCVHTTSSNYYIYCYVVYQAHSSEKINPSYCE